MPLIKTNRVCLAMDADAYILIHNDTGVGKFLLRRVFAQAGEQLQEAFQCSGILPYGDPVITPGYALKAKYVIHILQSKEKHRKDSTQAQYRKALLLAQAHHCETVIFAAPTYDYEETVKVNSVCRSFARESDMTIYFSGSAARYTGLSLELQRKLEEFLGIDREAIDFREFRRSIAEIDSPYEAENDLEQDKCLASFVMPKSSCNEDFVTREQLPQTQEAPRPQAAFPKAARPGLQSSFRAIQEFFGIPRPTSRTKSASGWRICGNSSPRATPPHGFRKPF